jgi:hypothetical protein
MRRILIAALSLFLAMPALAAAGQDKAIPPEEWRSMTAGKTVYYYIDGQLFGREYYWPGRDMVTFQHVSGQCADARWTWEDGRYCFYFDRPHCFAHVQRGTEIVIIPQNPDDGTDLTEQIVHQIAPLPFSCTPGVTS